MNEDIVTFIHETAIVEGSASLGHMSRVWHWTHVDDNAKIGSHCTLGQNVYIGKKVVIGSNCKIQNNVSIFTGVEIGNNVFIGPGTTFTNVKFPDARVDQHDHFEDTIIEDGVSIGANATILPGITIHEDAFVGAGAVVIKDVPKGVTVVGNPAKELIKRS